MQSLVRTQKESNKQDTTKRDSTIDEKTRVSRHQKHDRSSTTHRGEIGEQGAAFRENTQKFHHQAEERRGGRTARATDCGSQIENYRGMHHGYQRSLGFSSPHGSIRRFQSRRVLSLALLTYERKRCDIYSNRRKPSDLILYHNLNRPPI